LHKYFTKYHALVGHFVDNFQQENAIGNLDEITESVQQCCSEFAKNPTYDGSATNEENGKLFKRVFHLRRNQLIDLLKTLQNEGVRYRKGLTVPADQLDQLIFGCASAATESSPLFWFCVQRKNIFDALLCKKPHDQLDFQFLERFRGFGQHLLLNLARLREKGHKIGSNLRQLEKLNSALAILFSERHLVKNQRVARESLRQLIGASKVCATGLQRTCEIWSCAAKEVPSDGFKSTEFDRYLPKLLKSDVSDHLNCLREILADFQQVYTRLRVLEKESASKCDLFSGTDLVALDQCRVRLVSRLPEIETLLDVSTAVAGKPSNFVNKFLLECKQQLSGLMEENKDLTRNETGSLANCPRNELENSVVEKCYLVMQKLVKYSETCDQREIGLVDQIEKLDAMTDIISNEQVKSIVDILLMTSILIQYET